jgi:hypothetical protein
MVLTQPDSVAWESMRIQTLRSYCSNQNKLSSAPGKDRYVGHLISDSHNFFRNQRHQPSLPV